MSLFRTRLSLALLALSALALAFGANAAEPALPLDVQQRLEVLKTGFESFVLKSVTIPYDEGVKVLNAKVKPALERESAMAAKRKDLDALVRIKANIEGIDKGLLLTDADSPPPDSLKNVYAAYKLELAKIESSKKISLADAKQRYDKGLAQIQDELTAAQKVEGALQVKQLRESLAVSNIDSIPTGSAALPVLTDGAFINSLGMKFVPVEYDGKNLLTSIWATRYEDYAAYTKDVKQVDKTWAVGVAGAPVIQINWQEAVDFCEWLTKQERKAKLIGPKQQYSLPTGEEWASAKASFDSQLQPAWEWCSNNDPKRPGMKVIQRKAQAGGATDTLRYPDVGFRIVLYGAEAAIPTKQKSDVEENFVGSWIFKAGDFTMNKELLKDGTVISGNIPGKWKMAGKILRIDYANGAWAEFDLPAKEGRLKGKSNKNEDMTAEKIK